MRTWHKGRGVYKMRLLVILPICTLLSGCAGSIVGDALAGPEKLAAQDDGYCKSIGAEPGSDRYYQCRMTLTQQRESKKNTYSSSQGGSVVCNRLGNTTICN